MIDLERFVDQELLPALGDAEIRVLGRHGGRREASQAVDMQKRDVVVRLHRQKVFFEVLFRSAHDPSEWFDASTVAAYIGKASNPALSGDSDEERLRGVETLLRETLDAAVHVFSAPAYQHAKEDLIRLGRARTRDFLDTLKEKAESVRRGRGEKAVPLPSPRLASS
jgi:hypothetical protein